MELVVKRNMEARNNYLLEKKDTHKTRIEADPVPLTAPVEKEKNY